MVSSDAQFLYHDEDFFVVGRSCCRCCCCRRGRQQQGSRGERLEEKDFFVVSDILSMVFFARGRPLETYVHMLAYLRMLFEGVGLVRAHRTRCYFQASRTQNHTRYLILFVSYSVFDSHSELFRVLLEQKTKASFSSMIGGERALIGHRARSCSSAYSFNETPYVALY